MSKLTSFTRVVESVLSLARVNEDMPALVAAVAAADAEFDPDDDALKGHVVNAVLPAFMQDTVLFTRVNYAASFAAPGTHGPFMQAVTELLIAREADLSPAQILVLVESFRRTERYSDMEGVAMLLAQRLSDDTSSAAWKDKARCSYELHMAYSQMGDAAEDSESKRVLYGKSLELAERSAHEADLAEDDGGRLYALMNISELRCRHLGQLEEGEKLAHDVIGEAFTLAFAFDQLGEVDQKNRVLRVAMSTCRVLLEVAIVNALDKRMVRRTLEKLEVNPVFQAAKGQGSWVDTLPGEVRKYLEA